MTLTTIEFDVLTKLRMKVSVLDGVFVRYNDFPAQVKGFTEEDNDGNYTVYINSRLNYEQQEQARKHELKHIGNYDWDSDDDLAIIERRADI